MTTEELEKRLSQFMSAFEGVFDNDWEFTHTNLQDDFRHVFVSGDGTFLDPKVADEGDNWGNRGALLGAYRELVEAMKERGIYSELGEG